MQLPPPPPNGSGAQKKPAWQVMQPAPEGPQSVASCAVTQIVPWQQPGQAPQLEDWQVPAGPHHWPASHATHETPASPHNPFWLPSWQAPAASQQPRQLEELQGMPIHPHRRNFPPRRRQSMSRR
jgi:hypothetical protein